MRKNAFLESANSFLVDNQEIPLQLSKITTPLKYERNSQINSFKSLHKSPLVNNLSNLVLNNETTINLKREKFNGYNNNSDEIHYEKMLDATYFNLDLFKNSFMIKKHEQPNHLFFKSMNKESVDLNTSLNEKIEDIGENEFPLASIWDSPSKKIKLETNNFNNFDLVSNNITHRRVSMDLAIMNDNHVNNSNNNNFDNDLLSMIKQLKNEDRNNHHNGIGRYKIFPDEPEPKNKIQPSSDKKSINFKTPYKLKSAGCLHT